MIKARTKKLPKKKTGLHAYSWEKGTQIKTQKRVNEAKVNSSVIQKASLSGPVISAP